ncbi:MAG: formylglycine-generating enzyme family protein [Dysgonamonadaceae bacterium]|nr:formylglycine-generating enzyme family protein [Dysgonamonadaceae bacterium]
MYKVLKQIEAMKLLIIAVLVLSCSSVMFTACNDDDEEGGGGDTVNPAPDHFFTQIVDETVSFDMIKVDSGVFTLGGATNSYSAMPNAYLDTVGEFYIGATEVTQALWYAVKGSYPAEEEMLYACGYGSHYPVYYVSHIDLVGRAAGGQKVYSYNGVDYYHNGFCAQLSAYINGGTVGELHYRLPTEAEWEFAARGGNKARNCDYSGSNDLSLVGWWQTNNEGVSARPVGTRQANELGIFDLSGNVFEWVADGFFPYGLGIGQTTTEKAYRGGSWNGDAEDCRITKRYSAAQNWKYYRLGFRLAITL